MPALPERRMIPPVSIPPSCLNVVLIGFMGCGKTTLGRGLAAKLGFRFVDMDELIVQKAGMPIPEIFAASGEAGFRKLESDVLQELHGSEHCVVSTGGGVVTIPENIPLLKALGYVIFLNVPERTLFDRISRNQDRPLLRTANPRQTMHDLLEARMPLYQSAADLDLDVRGLTPDEAAYGLAESVRFHFSGSRPGSPGL